MMHRIPIPVEYLDIARRSQNKSKVFRGYVEGYLAKSYPEFRLVRIEKMTAICELK